MLRWSSRQFPLADRSCAGRKCPRKRSDPFSPACNKLRHKHLKEYRHQWVRSNQNHSYRHLSSDYLYHVLECSAKYVCKCGKVGRYGCRNAWRTNGESRACTVYCPPSGGPRPCLDGWLGGWIVGQSSSGPERDLVVLIDLLDWWEGCVGVGSPTPCTL